MSTDNINQSQIPQKYFENEMKDDQYKIVLYGLVKNPLNSINKAKVNYHHKDNLFAANPKQVASDLYEVTVFKADHDKRYSIGDKVYFRLPQVRDNDGVKYEERTVDNQKYGFFIIHKDKCISDELVEEILSEWET